MRILLVLGLVLFPACNGNIGDLFSLFPASAFAPDEGDGDGDTRPPGSFEPTEVAFLEAAQGVTGNVRNIATASVAGQTLVFLSAGVDGVHLLDATVPESMNSSSYITTISDDVLTGSASIAGGRVDEVAVVDNTFLICVAVGSGAANAVTVFHIPTLVDLAVSETADLSGAYTPGTGSIAVPGTASGNAGGATGASGIFAVATGGAELGVGSLSATPAPGTWTALPPVTSDTPRVDRFLRVVFNFPVAYATVAVDDDVKLATLAISAVPPGIVVTGDLDPLTGGFAAMDGNNGSAPGTFVAGPALDGANNLFVSGQNDIRTYSLAAPQDPLEGNPIFAAGIAIGGITATPGFVAVGDGGTLRVTALVGGVNTPVVALSTTGRRYFDVEFATSASGRFVLACAEERGLRVIQFSDIP